LVYPTGWGRANSGPIVESAQWAEVLAKTTTNRQLANTNDMKYQFICHLRLGAPLFRASYNLDSFRHRSSLGAYLTNRCN
jgi:hypothetical protein